MIAMECACHLIICCARFCFWSRTIMPFLLHLFGHICTSHIHLGHMHLSCMLWHMNLSYTSCRCTPLVHLVHVHLSVTCTWCTCTILSRGDIMHVSRAPHACSLLIHRVHVHLARSCTSSEPCGMCTSRRAPREDVNAYLPAQRVRCKFLACCVLCIIGINT